MDNEVQRFKSWLLENSLPTGSIALWYVLHHTEQRSGERFEAKNRILQSMTGLSEKGLQKARKRLAEEGLIEYTEQPRKCGEYRMSPLEVPQKVPQIVRQIVPQEVPQIVPQIVPQKVPQKVPQEVPQIVPQIVPQKVPQIVPQKVPQKIDETTDIMDGQVILPVDNNVFGVASKQFGILTKKS